MQPSRMSNRFSPCKFILMLLMSHTLSIHKKHTYIHTRHQLASWCWEILALFYARRSFGACKKTTVLHSGRGTSTKTLEWPKLIRAATLGWIHTLCFTLRDSFKLRHPIWRILFLGWFYYWVVCSSLPLWNEISSVSLISSFLILFWDILTNASKPYVDICVAWGSCAPNRLKTWSLSLPRVSRKTFGGMVLHTLKTIYRFALWLFVDMPISCNIVSNY